MNCNTTHYRANSSSVPGDPTYVASRGTGTLTLSGGAVNCGTLDVSRNASGNTFGSVGTVNLNGGILSVSRIGTATANSQTGQNGPAATFNFNGGTLRATASSTNFFWGNTASPALPIATVIKAGGALINDGGNAITLLEPLQHDSALGAATDGGLTKLNSGRLTLTANSTYFGPTTVSAGTLALNGSASLSNSVLLTVAAGAALDLTGLPGQTLTLVPGQSLGGFGTVTGTVLVAGGATLAPGSAASPGTLRFTADLTLNGTTSLRLNRAVQTNDALWVGGNLLYGGTLSLLNTSSNAFRAGDGFTLFSATTYSGSFRISPPTPGPGLRWDTALLLTQGALQVSPAPAITNVFLSGTNLLMHGSQGPPGGKYWVLSSTNVALPLASWTPLAANSFDSNGSFQVTNPFVPASPRRFYLLQVP